MSSQNPMPTAEELFQTIKRSSLPTAVVEGKYDIIFYRKIEESLADIGIDMLPAGNKEKVLNIKKRIEEEPVNVKVIFIVDKDLWIHKMPDISVELITTSGYSIENDLFCDGKIEDLLTAREREIFTKELHKFTRWYALAVNRSLESGGFAFRTHPNKIFASEDIYNNFCKLQEGEAYPDSLFQDILENYRTKLRGKSLFSLLQRQISASGRDVKFSTNQLMYFGSSRKGDNYKRIRNSIKEKFLV